MKLTDVIALAKAGYKKADIDELLKVPVDEQEPEAEDPESTDAETGPEEEAGEESPEESETDPVAYKQLYEDLKKDHDTLQKELKKAQKTNIKKDSSGGESTQSDLEDVFRAYM